MERAVRMLRSLSHVNRAAHAFIRWAYSKDRFRLEWSWRTLFRQLIGSNPALSEQELRELFRNELPRIRIDGNTLCHFPSNARTIKFHEHTHSLVRRVMRPGRPAAAAH